MDKNKLMQQARILRQKKLTRMAQTAKQSRPTVESGVVKYNSPVPMKPTEIRTLSAIPPANKVARSILPQQQSVSPQTIQPQKVIHKTRGCAGCRRNRSK